MIVAGIGSRETPADILKVMFWIGELVVTEGDTLRTGGAPGADQAFEAGAAAAMIPGEATIQRLTEIYLPWKSFEADNRSWIEPRLLEPANWTYEIAAQHHPSWTYLKRGAKMLHARNVHQVLGLTPDSPHTDAVICWTKGAKGGGGTGQAIRIAKAYDIPVYDLADPQVLADVRETYSIRH